MGNIKANKRNGFKREGEIGKRTVNWPEPYRLVRTGLDGGHDLTGVGIVGEVKAVRKGPKWLQDGLNQLANSPDKLGLLFVCLSQGPGVPVRWLTVLDLEDFIEEFVSVKGAVVYDEESNLEPLY